MLSRKQLKYKVEMECPTIKVGTGPNVEEFLPDNISKAISKIARKHEGEARITKKNNIVGRFASNRLASRFWHECRLHLKAIKT